MKYKKNILLITIHYKAILISLLLFSSSEIT